MKTMYVYILHCADDSYYVGVTNNVNRRFAEHTEGDHKESYTYSRRPLKLVYYEIIDGPNTAIAREKQLKKWSRKKKIALIENNIENLEKLAKKDFS